MGVLVIPSVPPTPKGIPKAIKPSIGEHGLKQVEKLRPGRALTGPTARSGTVTDSPAPKSWRKDVTGR